MKLYQFFSFSLLLFGVIFTSTDIMAYHNNTYPSGRDPYNNEYYNDAAYGGRHGPGRGRGRGPCNNGYYYNSCEFTNRGPSNVDVQYSYNISQFTPQGEAVLSDGTMWHINPADMFKTRRWQNHDVIIVCKNRIDAKEYGYKLWNTTADNRVEVNFVKAEQDRQSLKITSADSNTVVLSDSSQWRTSGDVHHWDAHDGIIVGLNNNCERPAFQYILINTNHKECVMANHLNSR